MAARKKKATTKRSEPFGISEAILNRLERQARDGMDAARRASLVTRLMGIFPELGGGGSSALQMLCEPPPDAQVCSEGVEAMRAMWKALKGSIAKYRDGHKVGGLDNIPHKDSLISLMKWVNGNLLSEREKERS